MIQHQGIFFSFTAYYHGLLKGVRAAKLEVASSNTLNTRMTALIQTVACAYKYRSRTTLLVEKRDIKAIRLLKGN
jgi:hypothetical protein